MGKFYTRVSGGAHLYWCVRQLLSEVKTRYHVFLVALLLASAIPIAKADTNAPLAHDKPTYTAIYPTSASKTNDFSYNSDLFIHHVDSIKYDVGGVFASTILLGLVDWDWGSSRFKFKSEGYFGKGTINGGMDKLGHAFSASLISDYFIDRIKQSATDNHKAAITGAILSAGVMSMIEVFDGFSGDHGFSYEDMTMNSLGIGFSYLRNTIPGMRELVDFRMEYIPSGNVNGFRPHSDYSGQKYLLAFKASGVDELADSPLRFLEFHAGFYARGFTAKEKRRGKRKRQKLYVRIGINLSEILLPKRQANEHFAKTWGRFGFEHFQVPYTYVGTDLIH